MIINNSFKQAIKNAFYDKEIIFYDAVITTDEEGGKKKIMQKTDNKAFVNISFNALDHVQKDMGLIDYIDAKITAEPEILKNGDIFEYGGRVYEVIEAKPYDSHLEAAAVKYGKH